MADLTVDDVEAFTGGRLSSGDDETQRMLDAALMIARRDVGWHVSPVRYSDVVVIDGPDSRILSLPTRKLVPAGEVQTVKITGAPDSGEFALTYAGEPTTGIAVDAVKADVQAALVALPNLTTGDVTVTGTNPNFTVTFAAALGDVDELTATNTFTGGTDPDVAITTTITGSPSGLLSVNEDGTDLVLTNLTWSAGGPPGLLERPISVRKKGRGFWSAEYQSIIVTMHHGYTEAGAAGWRHAVLSMVDQMSQLVTAGRGDLDLITKRVDDVSYTWGNPYASMAQDTLFSVRSILDDYRLPRVEFL